MLFNNGQSSVACTLRDISDVGCRLVIAPELKMFVPRRFELIVEIDGIRAECEVVWFSGSQLGARFIAPLRLGTPTRVQVVKPWLPLSKPSLRRSDA